MTADHIKVNPRVYMTESLPRTGGVLRDRLGDETLYTVAEVFAAGRHPGMLLDWADKLGRRKGQAFTTKGWRDRWIKPITQLLITE